MGFVVGGGNISIATALPPSSSVYCKHQIIYRISLSYFLCLPEASVSGPRRPVPSVCSILCINVQGLARNIRDLNVASSQYAIPLCCTFDLAYAPRVSFSGSRIRSPCLVVPGQDASGPRDGCIAYVRDGHGAFRQPKF